MSDFLISPELLNIYIEDARGHLDALDNCLLALEREGFDPETLSGALGPLHTLKGNSGMMGFGGIKEFVHRLEDVFAQVIGGRVGLSPAAFDRLFACASALREAAICSTDFGAYCDRSMSQRLIMSTIIPCRPMRWPSSGL